MKIQNINPSVYEYEIFPKVVLKEKKCFFTIRGLGIETALVPEKEYIISVIGQEENNSSVLLDISDWTKYDLIPVKTDANGRICFSYSFNREQIYTLRLAAKDNGSWIKLNDFRIFCAEKDLVERTPMRGNTHCHTCPSVDGHEDPFIAASIYRKAGFDFLAITDHHLIDGSKLAVESAKKIPTDMLLFYGEEVHVPNAYIHAVNIGAVFSGETGLDVWYHNNKDQCDSSVAEIASEAKRYLPAEIQPMDFAWRKWIADKIHENGGVAIIAHPFWEWDAHNTRDDMFRYLVKNRIYDGAEILHGQEPGCRDANMQVAFWNDLRAEGYYISPLGADDAHRRNYNWDYESSFNQVYSIVLMKEPTVEGLSEALKNGYSAAVEQYENAPEHVIATYRITKYVIFLLEEYYPLHDELCFEEGRAMRSAYLGSERSIETLSMIKGRINEFNAIFFSN